MTIQNAGLMVHQVESVTKFDGGEQGVNELTLAAADFLDWLEADDTLIMQWTKVEPGQPVLYCRWVKCPRN